MDPFVESLAEDPFAQFEQWYAEASAAGIAEPDAAALATATVAGVPSVRMVLVRRRDAGGFVFFTNRTSRKATELEATGHAALVFHWATLQRQVRVEGTVERVGDEESLAYFETRPRGAQIGAWASPQSSVISDRDELERRVRAETERFGEGEIPLPSFWGGYRVRPLAIEFWQGRADRLHDRARYVLESGSWKRRRLAP